MNTSVASAIEDFFSQYRVRKYAKGQIVIFNGDDTEYVYNIVSGRVKQYDVTYKGDEIILNVFKSPSFFPMSMAINKVENPYTYEAETDVEIRRAPVDDTLDFLKSHPDVVFDLLSRVYKGLDGVLSKMAYLMASSAKGRLMFEMLMACRRFGEEASDGSYSITMNESDLAARAGLSRETVSREMKKLEKDNLVHLAAGKVVIPNLTAFEEKLGKVI